METGVNERVRRADAERNRDLILDAARRQLTDNPRASMAEIATAAGVSRVTLYAHFSSRKELLVEVFDQSMADSERRLSRLDLTGDPMAALERLAEASWRIVGPASGILQVIREEAGDEEVRRRHEDPMARLRDLVRRGRREGAFRTDVPTAWLLACWQNILHGAAEEVHGGRLAERSADRVVWATVRSLFAPPP